MADACKRGRLAKDAKGIANIQQQVLDEWQSLFGVVVFANRLRSAELQAGVAACFVGGHAGADVLFGLGRYVRFDLLAQAFVAATPGCEVEKAREEAIQGSHARSPAFASRKRAMIAEVCSQSRFSASSSLRPARVRR